MSVFKHTGNSAADFLDELSVLMHVYGASIWVCFDGTVAVEIDDVYGPDGNTVVQDSVSLGLGDGEWLNGFTAKELADKWRNSGDGGRGDVIALADI